MIGIVSGVSTSYEVGILDLFSGVGGLALGWLAAFPPGTAKLVAAVDSDPTLRDSYQHNLPDTDFLLHSFNDPLESNEAPQVVGTLGLSPNDIDVILAGPPCQTFSAAGKRTLQWDARLVLHVCEVVRLLKPKAVIIENVPEFSRAQDGRLIGRVRVALADAGYVTDIWMLNAAMFGVPQTRSRCFTVALRGEVVKEAGLLKSLIAPTHHLSLIHI